LGPEGSPDAADRRGETVLVNGNGEAFSAKSLTGMAHWCKLAALPKGLTPHGLSKSLGVCLAEAEALWTFSVMTISIMPSSIRARHPQVRLAVQDGSSRASGGGPGGEVISSTKTNS